MSKQRNPEAVCGNCPFAEETDWYFMHCRRFPRIRRVMDKDWCGEHPEFWLETTAAEPRMLGKELAGATPATFNEATEAARIQRNTTNVAQAEELLKRAGGQDGQTKEEKDGEH